MKYTQHFQTKITAQAKPIPGEAQIQNAGGGYAYQITPWQQLHRFLILGSEGGTYYTSEHTLTQDNAHSTLACIRTDGPRVVKTIVEISDAGRAPKNDPALFALALCIKFGDLPTRQAAYNSLPTVARTASHLFTFLSYLGDLKGWSAGLRRAVAHWYNDQAPDKLVYQLIKYRDRAGYTHQDAIIQAHPKPIDTQHNVLYNWVVKQNSLGVNRPSEYGGEWYKFVDQLWAYEHAKSATTEQEVIRLITDFSLPWEAIDTKWLGSKDIWSALLPHLPLTATLRNLGRMGANGLLVPFSDAVGIIRERITNAEALKKARVHPIQVLSALRVYAQGHGLRGALAWQPVPQIIDALNDAFYLSFGALTPTNKRLVLAIDVSGSMDAGAIAGVPGLTPREAAACMALVTANIEPNYTIVGFSDQLVVLPISPKQRLDDVVKLMRSVPMGGTDCALPIMHARGYSSNLQQIGWYSHAVNYTKTHSPISVDAFVTYTDNETWAGAIHPSQALRLYRQESGLDARNVIVALTATNTSIAQPDDPYSLDVVGFDAAAPQLISDFIAGGL